MCWGEIRLKRRFYLFSFTKHLFKRVSVNIWVAFHKHKKDPNLKQTPNLKAACKVSFKPALLPALSAGAQGCPSSPHCRFPGVFLIQLLPSVPGFLPDLQCHSSCPAELWCCWLLSARAQVPAGVLEEPAEWWGACGHQPAPEASHHFLSPWHEPLLPPPVCEGECCPVLGAVQSLIQRRLHTAGKTALHKEFALRKATKIHLLAQRYKWECSEFSQGSPAPHPLVHS